VKNPLLSAAGRLKPWAGGLGLAAGWAAAVGIRQTAGPVFGSSPTVQGMGLALCCLLGVMLFMYANLSRGS
jgi:hypothetical protein